jgi:hypothetical protein
LDISHLDPAYAEHIIAMIKWYWSIFDEHGTFTPVHGYQCVIDTGNTKLIAVKKIMYDSKEMVILHKSIAALVKVGQSVRFMTANGYSMPSLKQSHIRSIF